MTAATLFFPSVSPSLCVIGGGVETTEKWPPLSSVDTFPTQESHSPPSGLGGKGHRSHQGRTRGRDQCATTARTRTTAHAHTRAWRSGHDTTIGHGELERVAVRTELSSRKSFTEHCKQRKRPSELKRPEEEQSNQNRWCR